MAFALKAGILSFNVESEPELEALSEVASSAGARARVAIRVNPDVDAKTHAKISTGKSENKFGIPFLRAPQLYAEARRLPGIAATGIHMHIGSQITDLAPFRDAFRLMRDLALELRREGTRSTISISAAVSACPITAAMTCRRIPMSTRPWSRRRSAISASSCSSSRGG